MSTKYSRIQELCDAMDTAIAAERASPTSANKVACKAANVALKAAQEAARLDFAEQHGWVLAKKGFTLNELRNGHHSIRWTDDLWPTRHPRNPLDHCEYYRFGWGAHFPAAILSHEYGRIEDSEEFAKANGLIATRLTASWYSPANATAVVYTSPLIPFAEIR
jgi:hypothetical protein